MQLLLACFEQRGKWDPKEVSGALKSGILSLLMPVVILGGIYSGFFTATESAGSQLFTHSSLRLLFTEN